MSYVIYKATSPSGNVYVGMTKDLSKRIKSHKSQALKGQTTSFHHAIRKYGIENITWEVLEEIQTEDRHVVGDREKYWIKKLNTLKKGYNESIGGDGFAGTQEVKDKISNTLKYKYHGTQEVRLKHSKERGGKSIKIYKAIMLRPAVGFDRKQTAEYIKGEFVARFETQVDACESLNLSRSKVCNCLKGLRKTHKGYIFEFEEPSDGC